MRSKTGWFVAAVLLVLIAPQSRAQTTHLNLWTQCAVTPFIGCVRAQLSTIYYPDGTDRYQGIPGGVTEIRWQLENLDGLWGNEQDYAMGLKTFALYGIENLSGNDFLPRILSRNPVVISSEGNVVTDGHTDTFNLIPGTAGFRTNLQWDYDSFLFGCDIPEGSSPFAGYDATCKGNLTYSGFSTGQLALTENSYASMSWVAFRTDVPNTRAGEAYCTTGVDCVTVTPEPTTMLLVGTGLSLAAFARRRRRRST